MKEFGGKVLFLDRDDINTDEIIPAKYLTEISKTALKPYLLEDLKMEGFDSKKDIEGKKVIISKENFGCGSSREHAPWALEVNDIHVVIAKNFARIFRQNMFNGGMLAIELDNDLIDSLFEKYSSKDLTIDVDVENDKLILKTTDGDKEEISYSISSFEKDLVLAGGWLEYADKNY